MSSRRLSETVNFYPVWCEFNVVGESFYKDAIAAVLRAGAEQSYIREHDGWTRLGVRFWLIPEPTNKYDPNAVAVCADRGGEVKVGHIPKDDAKRLTLTEPEEVYGIIVGTDNNYGVKLDGAHMQELLPDWKPEEKPTSVYELTPRQARIRERYQQRERDRLAKAAAKRRRKLRR